MVKSLSPHSYLKAIRMRFQKIDPFSNLDILPLRVNCNYNVYLRKRIILNETILKSDHDVHAKFARTRTITFARKLHGVKKKEW